MHQMFRGFQFGLYGLLLVCGVGMAQDPAAVEKSRLRRDEEEREVFEKRRLEQETLQLQHYLFGGNREGWSAIEKRLRNPLQREISGRVLMNILINRPDATVDARILACRGLRLIGKTETDLALGFSGVQALTSLVRDNRLSGEACMALQEKDARDVNEPLREALPLVENSLKGQLMTTLARRRDLEAVPVIVSLLTGIEDESIQRIGIAALGQIGGKAAMTALSGNKVSESLREEAEHAALAAAARSAVEGSDDRAAGLAFLVRLAKTARSPMVRLGAFYETARLDPSKREASCRLALTNRSGSLLDVASRIFALLDTAVIEKLYGEFFESLSPEAKTLLVELWKPDYGESDKLRALSVDLEAGELLRRAAQRAVDRLKE